MYHKIKKMDIQWLSQLYKEIYWFTKQLGQTISSISFSYLQNCKTRTNNGNLPCLRAYPTNHLLALPTNNPAFLTKRFLAINTGDRGAHHLVIQICQTPIT